MLCLKLLSFSIYWQSQPQIRPAAHFASSNRDKSTIGPAFTVKILYINPVGTPLFERRQKPRGLGFLSQERQGSLRRVIEEDLRGVAEGALHLPDDELTLRCEQTIRNYDPCISCATHFLKLEVDRG